MTKQMNVFFLNASCSALFILAFLIKTISHYSFSCLYLTMKFLLTSLLVLWGCCAWAQSSAPKELTYSRVILLDSASVVPAGKVWKVESYLADNPNYYYGTPFLINGRGCWSFYFDNIGGVPVAGSQIVQFPFWLPAGTSLSPWIDTQGRLRGQFSIIEFNEN
jgi:hypothetical protein